MQVEILLEQIPLLSQYLRPVDGELTLLKTEAMSRFDWDWDLGQGYDEGEGRGLG